MKYRQYRHFDFTIIREWIKLKNNYDIKLDKLWYKLLCIYIHEFEMTCLTLLIERILSLIKSYKNTEFTDLIITKVKIPS